MACLAVQLVDSNAPSSSPTHISTRFSYLIADSIAMSCLTKSMLEWLITSKENCTIPTLFKGRWADLHGAKTSSHKPLLRVKVLYGRDGLVRAKLINAKTARVYIPWTAVGHQVDVDAICNALHEEGLKQLQNLSYPPPP
ncbi:hypothetical protein BOTBODRAFT_178452 [Botryobasidium botryosum FD-172 SS1]|uniref:Uncharacterized protein n=1 Tax=Botryobasidium botryosum (strain FD-172 SS1) TaxID=930990 RepID=A0A067M3D2_BOTB1|nr:hypothetical protein BOTBODRAFT_178452 [Botryobasidium botryosum FD-172 SS1]